MKSRILIVDDDPGVRESLSKVLRGEGYDVLAAGNGEEVLDRCDPRQFDLLVLDLNLPCKNGWDTFGCLTDRNPSLPVILLAGQSHQYEMARAAGIGALMEKPVDAEALLQTIRQLLADAKKERAGQDAPTSGAPSNIRNVVEALRTHGTEPFRCVLPHGWFEEDDEAI